MRVVAVVIIVVYVLESRVEFDSVPCFVWHSREKKVTGQNGRSGRSKPGDCGAHRGPSTASRHHTTRPNHTTSDSSESNRAVKDRQWRHTHPQHPNSVSSITAACDESSGRTGFVKSNKEEAKRTGTHPKNGCCHRTIPRPAGRPRAPTFLQSGRRAPSSCRRRSAPRWA